MPALPGPQVPRGVEGDPPAIAEVQPQHTHKVSSQHCNHANLAQCEHVSIKSPFVTLGYSVCS